MKGGNYSRKENIPGNTVINKYIVCPIRIIYKKNTVLYNFKMVSIFCVKVSGDKGRHLLQNIT